MTYKKYHSSVKLAYAMGMEKQLLPESFRSQIAPSTAHHWKQDDPDEYIGSEYASMIGRNLEELQLILDGRVLTTRKMFMSICRIQLTLVTLFGKDQFRELMIRNRESISNLIDQVGDNLGGTRIVCRHLQISYHTYITWKRYRYIQCPSSPINLCFKKVPLQIPYAEISALRTYMANPRYSHWSIASVWGLCFRHGKTSMSRSTWYRYCNTLGISSSRKKAKLKHKRGSVQAETVNSIWHMDVTYLKTIDNVRFYLYTVMDNYSRKILAYDLTRKLSGAIRVESLKRAIANEFQVTIGSDADQLDLIVDGGSENNNKTVEEFIHASHVAIDKKVALKDVKFSNSVVEGSYRIMKQSYIRTKEIHSDNIQEEVATMIQDINEHKPHYVHKIYTPSEIHNWPELKNRKTRPRNSLSKRFVHNQQFSCFKGCD